MPQCGLCRGDYASERPKWGCDEDAERSVWDAGCPECGGGNSAPDDCPRCKGDGLAEFFRCPSSIIQNAGWTRDFLDAYLDYRLRGLFPTEGGAANQSAWWERARALADKETNRLEKEASDASSSIPPPTP